MYDYNQQFMGYNKPRQNVEWVHTSGMQGVREHIVQPNQTVWLMDNNEPIFYVKTADSLGVTSIKAYRFSEINVKQPMESYDKEFVTKEEIDGIIENKINILADKLMKGGK